MAAPNQKECLALLAKYNVPENIVEHSRQVARVALFLGKKLNKAGQRVNLPLLQAAALLHDIDKKMCLDDSSKEHGKEAAAILCKEGFPKIAEIAAQHKLSQVFKAPFSSWEAKLVYYADKRVNQSTIVSVEERFDYLVGRYGRESGERMQGILEAKPKVLAIEEEIFGRIASHRDLRGLNEAE